MNGVVQSVIVFLIIRVSCCYGQSQSTSANSKCLTPDNYVGKCINIRDCRELFLLLEYRGRDPRVVQFLRKSQCGVVGKDPKVCCSTGVVNTPKPTSTTTTKDDNSDSKVCGIPDVSQKIIGGEGVALGDYPWMAALGYRRKKNSKKPEWICGGSLISSKYVLTAAHCLHGISPWELYMVRLGDVNLNDTVKDGATPIDVPIESSLIHEKYTSSPITHDIALVKLRNPVQYTELIRPICLPAAQEFKSVNVLDYQYGFVAGWGKTSFMMNTFSSHLQDLRMPILPIDVCKKAYKTIPRSYVDDKNICAGYLEGQKDSCQGDSGGPLMWINAYDSKYYLIGIVSYGYKCAEPGYPGVYTKVADYMDWIRLHAK